MFHVLFREADPQVVRAGDGSEVGCRAGPMKACRQLLRLSERDELFGKATRWRPTGPDGGLDGLAAVFGEQLAYYRLRAPLLAAIAEVSAYDPALREAHARPLPPQAR